VPALGGASVGKREGGGGPGGILVAGLGRGGGTTPPLEGTTEVARGIAATGETALVADFPGDAV
jgi:hypothetical protein